MIRNAILAAGLVASSASQLRLPGLPIGPGELCLALWLGLSITRILGGAHVAATPALCRLSVFWIIFALTLSIGALIGLLIENPPNVGAMGHDAMAYVLMAAITCLAAAEPDGHRSLRQTGWFLIGFGNVFLAIQIAIGWGWITAGSVDPWYWDRFRGLSENPNQLALYSAVLGPLAIHFATTSTHAAARTAGLAGAVLPVVVGRLTKSDTFVVATFVGVAFFAGLRVRTWLAAPHHSLRYMTAIFVILATPLGAIAVLPYAAALANDAEVLALSLAKDKGGDATSQTANLRLQLWGEALRKGLESGSLGLGPGPHLPQPNVANRQDLPNPFEAHSTLLDLFTQGGLVGVLALLWLGASAAVLVLRARLDALVALIASLAVFSISHFILRQPVVWFAVTLCVAAGSASTLTSPLLQRR